MKLIAIFSLLLAIAYSLKNINETGDARKHYGLSYSSRCTDYFKTFKCMSACKSIGFQIYRMDYRCKCSCHDIKTSTILPFFKWGTNGTTRKMHETVSPQLYHIVGTLSPKSTTTEKSTTIESDYYEQSDDEEDKKSCNETEEPNTDSTSAKDDNEDGQSDKYKKSSNETEQRNEVTTPVNNDSENGQSEDKNPSAVTKVVDTNSIVKDTSNAKETTISENESLKTPSVDGDSDKLPPETESPAI